MMTHDNNGNVPHHDDDKSDGVKEHHILVEGSRSRARSMSTHSSRCFDLVKIIISPFGQLGLWAAPILMMLMMTL
jgi:hypothetical protein